MLSAVGRQVTPARPPAPDTCRSTVSTTWVGVVLDTHSSGRSTRRWARAATAIAFTSSGRTKSRPRRAASARASFSRARLPRGEAPSVTRGSVRVAWASATM